MSLADRKFVPAGDFSKAKVGVVENMDDFLAAVDVSRQHKLAIFKAYVPWCRACKAFDLKFRKLSLELQEQQAPAAFYEMDVFAVKDVKTLLEIKVAPSIVMYVDGEKVESFSCGPKKFEMVAQKVAERLQLLSCDENGCDADAPAYTMPDTGKDEADAKDTPDL